MGQGIASGINTQTLEFYPFWGGPFRDVEESSWSELKGCVAVGTVLWGWQEQGSGVSPVVGFLFFDL